MESLGVSPKFCNTQISHPANQFHEFLVLLVYTGSNEIGFTILRAAATSLPVAGARVPCKLSLRPLPSDLSEDQTLALSADIIRYSAILPPLLCYEKARMPKPLAISRMLSVAALDLSPNLEVSLSPYFMDTPIIHFKSDS